MNFQFTTILFFIRQIPMKTLYLDHNIIIDIKSKRKPAVAEAIENIDNKQYQILFGPAHIEEVAALKMHHGEDEGEIDVLLNLLAQTTNSKAILPYERDDTTQVKLTGVFISDEHPRITYNRVISGYSKNHIAEDHQKAKIANGEYFEKKTGITSRETNSIDIQKELDIFKPRLHQIIVDNYNPEFPIYSEQLPKKPPACHEINFDHLGKFFHLHEMAVEKIFEFLESRRYFPDKSTQFLSGLHDTTHAIYAAYCDVFVTNDKKLKNKTAATYKWLGIKTLVINSDELIAYLANSHNTPVDIPRIFNITESAHRIHNPITPDKLATLGAALRLEVGARVLDLGSGSGEMLCTWARDHGVVGTGVDLSQLFTEQAKRRAVELGVAERVRFIHGDAAGFVAEAPVDVAACVGATWIGGGVAGTLELLARSLRPGGLFLIGEPYWRQLPPTEAVAQGCLARSLADFLTLPQLLASFGELGYDVVEMVLADQDGWDRYEAAKWLTMRRWLAANPDDELAGEVRAQLTSEPVRYATYTREYLGWGVFALMQR